jgi:hypothetical protein
MKIFLFFANMTLGQNNKHHKNSKISCVRRRTYVPPSGEPHRFHNPEILEVFQFTGGFSLHKSCYELCIFMWELEGQGHDLKGLGRERRREREGGIKRKREGSGVDKWRSCHARVEETSILDSRHITSEALTVMPVYLSIFFFSRSFRVSSLLPSK